MRKTSLVVAVLCAAGVPVALGQGTPPETELRYEVRRFDANNNTGWASSMNALPGDRIEVRAMVSYVGTTPVIALGQITFQPTISNWATGDTLLTNSLLGLSGPTIFPDGIGPSGGFVSTPPALTPDAPGVYGRIAPFTAVVVAINNPNSLTYYRGHSHSIDGTSYLRIARADITNWFGVGATSSAQAANNVTGVGGVTCFQGSLGATRHSSAPPPLMGTENILVFKFGFTLSFGAESRDLRIFTPSNGFGRSTSPNSWLGPATGWFTSTDEIGIGSHRTFAESVDGFIHVVPAPSAAALLGLGAVLAIRRRR